LALGGNLQQVLIFVVVAVSTGIVIKNSVKVVLCFLTVCPGIFNFGVCPNLADLYIAEYIIRETNILHNLVYAPASR
jgi:hypothetical protein